MGIPKVKNGVDFGKILSLNIKKKKTITKWSL